MNRGTVAVAVLAMVVTSAASGGCHRPDGAGPGGSGSGSRVDGVPGPIASALLAFAAEQGTPPPEVARAWVELESLARQVRSRQRLHRGDTVDALNDVMFGATGGGGSGPAFEREIDRDDPRFLLLPGVVQGRRGGCVGLSALYLALGEQLGIPLSGVLVPGHFFVRLTGARPRNVELLRRGEAMPDQWYRTKYGPWDGAASAYLRPLSLDEVMAVHWFNAGNQRRDGGDLPAAARAYRRALQDFPAFAEAAASLGAINQLHGDLTAAADAYREAAHARPDLPGLANNLGLLEAERATPPTTTTTQRSTVYEPADPGIHRHVHPHAHPRLPQHTNQLR